VNEIMFGRIIEPASFALAAVFTLGCSILVSIFMIPRLRKIDPASSLKSVE
jgi:hypothetical protein